MIPIHSLDFWILGVYLSNLYLRVNRWNGKEGVLVVNFYVSCNLKQPIFVWPLCVQFRNLISRRFIFEHLHLVIIHTTFEVQFELTNLNNLQFPQNIPEN